LNSREELYQHLAHIAISEFPDIVQGTIIIEGKLRIIISDGSFIDIWLSEKKKGVYAYHWERRNVNGTIYRHNNIPDKKARKLETFPKHFHNEKEQKVEESYISNIPEEALKYLLKFARSKLRK